MPSQTEQGTITSPTRPVERVVRTLVGLGLEDDAISCPFPFDLVEAERFLPFAGQQKNSSFELLSADVQTPEPPRHDKGYQ
jgi:hypothetical protein